MYQVLRTSLLAAGLTVLALSAGAQSAAYRSPTTRLADSLLAPLNQTEPRAVGLLYERVFQWAQLDRFDGQSTPRDTSSADHFVQAWADIRAAAYPPNQRALRSPADTAMLPTARLARTLIDERQRAGRVPLGVLVFDMAFLDPSAVTDNLVRWGADSLLHDVAGRSRSPWLTRRTAVAAALTAAPVPKNVATVFELTADLVDGRLTTWQYCDDCPIERPGKRLPDPTRRVESNNIAVPGPGPVVINDGTNYAANVVDYVEVNFADGQGYRSMHLNDVVSITYAADTSTRKLIRFIIHLKDGSAQQAQAELALGAAQASPRPTSNDSYCKLVSFNSNAVVASLTYIGQARPGRCLLLLPHRRLRPQCPPRTRL